MELYVSVALSVLVYLELLEFTDAELSCVLLDPAALIDFIMTINKLHSCRFTRQTPPGSVGLEETKINMLQYEFVWSKERRMETL